MNPELPIHGVGPCSPTVPGTLVEKIWWGEFIDLNSLAWAQESTLAEALHRRTRVDSLFLLLHERVSLAGPSSDMGSLSVPSTDHEGCTQLQAKGRSSPTHTERASQAQKYHQSASIGTEKGVGQWTVLTGMFSWAATVSRKG